jgi:hypothetical protein
MHGRSFWRAVLVGTMNMNEFALCGGIDRLKLNTFQFPCTFSRMCLDVIQPRER